MQNLIEKINQDIVAALKGKDSIRVSTLRGVKAACLGAGIQAKRSLTDLEVVGIVRKESAKRADSIEQFKAGGREDLATKERCELNILSEYLPLEISDFALYNLIEQAINEQVQPVTIKDMGKVIKIIIERVGGQASSSRISQSVKSRLNL